jgi:hypothetical protein
LVLLSGVIGSMGFRVESGAEVSLLGEQIIDYVEVQQSGFMELTVESPKDISSYGFLKRIIVDFVKAGSVAISG